MIDPNTKGITLIQSALENLANNMDTTISIVLKSINTVPKQNRNRLIQRMGELEGARTMVLEWVQGLEK